MAVNTPSASAEKKLLEKDDWHALLPEEVLEALRVEDGGLTSAEVERRRGHYGLNQLTEAPRPGTAVSRLRVAGGRAPARGRGSTPAWNTRLRPAYG